MPSGTTAKRLLIGAGVGLVVLLLAGFVLGAIGSAMFGTDRFLDKPGILVLAPGESRDFTWSVTVEAL